jgi:zinc protease
VIHVEYGGVRVLDLDRLRRYRVAEYVRGVARVPLHHWRWEAYVHCAQSRTDQGQALHTVCAASLWLVASFLPASAQPADWRPTASVEGITEYRLPNGLQVLLVPDDSKPTTTVNVTYRVGSRHENYGETGMAHLLEHLVFKGTPTTRNVWAEFSKRGLRANGTTSYDRTNYYASFAANDDNLRWYLSWQADVMVNSFIAKADLDTEMTVVRNEFESGENNPGRVLLQRTLGRCTTGTTTARAPSARARHRKRRHLAPAGLLPPPLPARQRHADGQRQVRHAPGAGLGGAVLRRAAPPDAGAGGDLHAGPAPAGRAPDHVRRSGGTPLIYMTYHVPAAADPDFAAIQLLSLVLGDTPGGRLHKRVVEQRLAAQAFAGAFALAEPGPLILGAGLAPGQDVDAARAAMAAVVDGLPKEPVTAEELERARTSWLNGWEQGFTDPEQVGVALSEAIARRLAPVLPAARPCAPAHAGRHQPRGRHLAAARQPHGGHLRADRAARTRPARPSESTCGPGEGLSR